MNLRESIKKILKEDRFKGYKRFLKDNVFMDFPDYIINDMFRESGDLDYSQVQGMTKKQIIDYFLNGEGHKFFDRWGGYKGQKPKVVEIKWNDLTEPLQKFLKNKMSGENPNFPDSREKIVQMMNREPNLGKGDNEPVLLKYNNEGKIEDIPGGNHRTYVAFELNNFNPILMKAYVDNDPKPNLQESIKRILRENVNQITIRRRIYELDNLLAELVRTTYSPNKICKYSNSEQFIEHLIYNIINDHIYYIYFEHIDSSSKEWESLYRKIEEYLRIKYENKLDEYYHMNCGD
jgi:hypothetical protein